MNLKISEVENKIPDTSGLVTTTVLNTKIGEVVNNFPDYTKYITISEFNKLTAQNFHKQITSNKTKHLEVQKKLNSLVTKDYNFFFGRIYFTNNDGSQNTFVYQPSLDIF